MTSIFGPRYAGRRAASALLCLALACPMAAVADEATEKRAAGALLEEGVRLYNEKRYEDALDHYRRSYERWQASDTLCNMGSALKRLGRDAEAAMHYARCLHGSDVDPTIRSKVRDQLEALGGKLAVVDVQITPADAQLAVDDKPVDTELRPWLHLPPGEHVLVAARAGYRRSAPVTLYVRAGRSYVVPIALQPIEETPRAATTAPRREDTPRAATIAPRREETPAPKKVEPLAKTKADSPAPARSRYRVPAFVVGGLALGALAGAAILTAVYYPDYRERRDTCDTHGCPDDYFDDLAPKIYAGYGLVAAGAALVITDAVLWGLDARDRKRTRETQRGAWITPFGAGVAVQGRF